MKILNEWLRRSVKGTIRRSSSKQGDIVTQRHSIEIDRETNRGRDDISSPTDRRTRFTVVFEE